MRDLLPPAGTQQALRQRQKELRALNRQWAKQRTPAQRQARRRINAPAPRNWRDLRCRRHPEVPMVRPAEPGRLYCYLCLRSYAYKDLQVGQTL